MTIGIAATGPWAGAGVLAGLRAVENIASGAIGGFVSLAVLTQDNQLLRAETQVNGTRGLFRGPVPKRILNAPFAGLISSGPDRPEPLSQFVAAAPGIGIVTGHRFPQSAVGDGRPANRLILEAMEAGAAPGAAIDGLIAQYPDLDAGFIALSVTGEIGLGNMPSVLRRSDHGAAIWQSDTGRAQVATIHNAILPRRTLAALTNEIVLDEMRHREMTVHVITVSAGAVLRHGPCAEIHVDQTCNAVRILHPDAGDMRGTVSFGLGDRVKVLKQGEFLGWLGLEPFMTITDGTILSLDGKPFVDLPVHDVPT